MKKTEKKKKKKKNIRMNKFQHYLDSSCKFRKKFIWKMQFGSKFLKNL